MRMPLADTVESLRSLLRDGAMEDREITVDVPVKEPGAGKEGGSSPKGMGLGGLGDLDVTVAGALLVAALYPAGRRC